MAGGEPQFCKVLKPTKEEWSLPFTEYVEAQLKLHKNFAMLKIIPPRGYIARREGFPKLEQVRIQTPIRQHVRPRSVQESRLQLAEVLKLGLRILCGRAGVWDSGNV